MSFSEEEKAMWLADWKESGKKPWTYARENGLVPQTFYKWAKNESQKAAGFVEIQVHPKPKPELPQEILVEIRDIRIHIPLSVWIEYPRATMEGLKAVI
jgi:transposase-like protein